MAEISALKLEEKCFSPPVNSCSGKMPKIFSVYTKNDKNNRGKGAFPIGATRKSRENGDKLFSNSGISPMDSPISVSQRNLGLLIKALSQVLIRFRSANTRILWGFKSCDHPTTGSCPWTDYDQIRNFQLLYDPTHHSLSTAKMNVLA